MKQIIYFLIFVIISINCFALLEDFESYNVSGKADNFTDYNQDFGSIIDVYNTQLNGTNKVYNVNATAIGQTFSIYTGEVFNSSNITTLLRFTEIDGGTRRFGVVINANQSNVSYYSFVYEWGAQGFIFSGTQPYNNAPPERITSFIPIIDQWYNIRVMTVTNTENITLFGKIWGINESEPVNYMANATSILTNAKLKGFYGLFTQNVSAQYDNITVNEVIVLPQEPEEPSNVGLPILDLNTKTGVLLFLGLIIAYFTFIVLTLMFKELIFTGITFIIGVFLGLFLFQISTFMTMLFIMINILILLKGGKI